MRQSILATLRALCSRRPAYGSSGGELIYAIQGVSSRVLLYLTAPFAAYDFLLLLAIYLLLRSAQPRGHWVVLDRSHTSRLFRRMFPRSLSCFPGFLEVRNRRVPWPRSRLLEFSSPDRFRKFPAPIQVFAGALNKGMARPHQGPELNNLCMLEPLR
jgi:hypothetical protein